jgi:hypothetical protein
MQERNCVNLEELILQRVVESVDQLFKDPLTIGKLSGLTLRGYHLS